MAEAIEVVKNSSGTTVGNSTWGNAQPASVEIGPFIDYDHLMIVGHMTSNDTGVNQVYNYMRVGNTSGTYSSEHQFQRSVGDLNTYNISAVLSYDSDFAWMSTLSTSMHTFGEKGGTSFTYWIYNAKGGLDQSGNAAYVVGQGDAQWVPSATSSHYCNSWGQFMVADSSISKANKLYFYPNSTTYGDYGQLTVYGITGAT
jgi:hypothetical protein